MENKKALKHQTIDLGTRAVDVSSLRDPLGDDISHVIVAEAEISGMGTDANPSVSTAKAISEFAERYILKSFGEQMGISTSNGLAAHMDLRVAEESALTELVERDVFLLSWLTKTPSLEITEDVKGWYLNQTSKFSDNKLNIRIGLCGISNKRVVLVGIVQKQDTGRIIVSTSSGFDQKIVALKLIYDLRRAVFMLENEIVQHADQIQKPSDHISFYLNRDRGDSLSWMFTQCKNKEPMVFPDLSKITLSRFSIFRSDRISRHVVQASSPLAQQYFCGETTQGNINWDRLKHISFEGEINYAVHPLG